MHKCWVCTLHDVLPGNTDEAVSVTAGLLMIKAQSVKKLMLDGIVVDTAATSQRQGLCVTCSPNFRVTSGKIITFINNIYQ